MSIKTEHLTEAIMLDLSNPIYERCGVTPFYDAYPSSPVVYVKIKRRGNKPVKHYRAVLVETSPDGDTYRLTETFATNSYPLGTFVIGSSAPVPPGRPPELSPAKWRRKLLIDACLANPEIKNSELAEMCCLSVDRCIKLRNQFKLTKRHLKLTKRTGDNKLADLPPC